MGPTSIALALRSLAEAHHVAPALRSLVGAHQSSVRDRSPVRAGEAIGTAVRLAGVATPAAAMDRAAMRARLPAVASASMSAMSGEERAMGILTSAGGTASALVVCACPAAAMALACSWHQNFLSHFMRSTDVCRAHRQIKVESQYRQVD